MVLGGNTEENVTLVSINIGNGAKVLSQVSLRCNIQRITALIGCANETIRPVPRVSHAIEIIARNVYRQRNRSTYDYCAICPSLCSGGEMVLSGDTEENIVLISISVCSSAMILAQVVLSSLKCITILVSCERPTIRPDPCVSYAIEIITVHTYRQCNRVTDTYFMVGISFCSGREVVLGGDAEESVAHVSINIGSCAIVISQVSLGCNLKCIAILFSCESTAIRPDPHVSYTFEIITGCIYR